MGEAEDALRRRIASDERAGGNPETSDSDTSDSSSSLFDDELRQAMEEVAEYLRDRDFSGGDLMQLWDGESYDSTDVAAWELPGGTLPNILAASLFFVPDDMAVYLQDRSSPSTDDDSPYLNAMRKRWLYKQKFTPSQKHMLTVLLERFIGKIS